MKRFETTDAELSILCAAWTIAGFLWGALSVFWYWHR